VQADLQPAPAGARRGRARQRGRSGHHRTPRSLRRHPRDADLRSDAGAGADGPGLAAPRAVRRRRRRVPEDPRMSRGTTGKLKLAVVGATGAVGEAMLSVLAERRFPAEVVALASGRSAGDLVAFGDDELLVQDLAGFDPA